ncbi:Uma2 family endonuclease [Aphanothece sacrum]
MSLEDFLDLPEVKPAREYIDGKIIRKPMPKGKHSRLQLKLCNSINEVAESSKIAYAFRGLSCSFGTRSIVPDVSVFTWSKIPFDRDGEPIHDFLLCPDWVIEILSPQQSSNRVTGNILYCLENGCKLGWLIDPDDRSILMFFADQSPKLLQGDESLLTLAEIPLNLTINQVFSWLKMQA